MISRRAFLRTAGRARSRRRRCASRCVRSFDRRGDGDARDSRRCRRRRAASHGFTTTRDRRRGSCPNHSVLAVRSLTSTTTAGWTSTSSTAGQATSISPPRESGNALYKNNRDGTFTDVDGAGRRGGRHVRNGRCRRLTTNNDGYPDSIRDSVRAADSLSQQRRRNVYRRDGEGGAPLARLDHERRLVRLRQQWPPRSLRLQLRRVRPQQGGLACADRDKTDGHLIYHYCVPHLLSPPRVRSGTTTETALHSSAGDGVFDSRARQGPRSRRDGRQQRRPP